MLLVALINFFRVDYLWYWHLLLNNSFFISNLCFWICLSLLLLLLFHYSIDFCSHRKRAFFIFLWIHYIAPWNVSMPSVISVRSTIVYGHQFGPCCWISVAIISVSYRMIPALLPSGKQWDCISYSLVSWHLGTNIWLICNGFILV